MLITYTLLFILLSPGVIFTLPAKAGFNMWFSESMTPLAVLVHACIFFFIVTSINSNYIGLGILNKIEPTLLGANY